MKSLIVSAVIAMLASGPVFAETLARAASEGLLRAATLLEQSETAGDRVGALTDTIRAYETGLQSMRGEVRRLTLKQRALEAALADEDKDVAAVLALMQNATLQTQAQTILHPGSAAESIRAGTLARAVVPSLLERAEELEGLLTELRDTESVLLAAKSQLSEGLGQVRLARNALAEALAAREDLPPRLATDDAAIAALIDGAETLSALADSLSVTEPTEAGAVAPTWQMPVSGDARLQPRNDAGGSQGVEISTTPGALITAPVDATVRFSGEIPGFDHVAILEADGAHLVTLAGLGATFVVRDEIVAKGAPVGFMSDAQDNLNAGDGQSSLNGNETLYMEIRREGVPIDPAVLLTAGQE